MLGLAVLQVASAPPAAADESCDLTDFSGYWKVEAPDYDPTQIANTYEELLLVVQPDGAFRAYRLYATARWGDLEYSLPYVSPTLFYVGQMTCSGPVDVLQILTVAEGDLPSYPIPSTYLRPLMTYSWWGAQSGSGVSAMAPEHFNDLDGSRTGDSRYFTANYIQDWSYPPNDSTPAVPAPGAHVGTWTATWMGPVSGDIDSDGVPNQSDRCPWFSGPPENDGCPASLVLSTHVAGSGADSDEVPLVWFASVALSGRPLPNPTFRWYLDDELQAGTGAGVNFNVGDPGHHTLRVEAYDALGRLQGVREASIDPPSGLRAHFTFQFATKQPSKYTFDGWSSGGSVAKYRWTVDGKVLAPKATPTLAVNFPPGPHDVTLAVQETGTGRWSDPYTREVVAYRLKLAGMGETDAVAKPVLAAPDSICSGSGFEIEPKSNWWTSLSVVQTGLKRNYKASVPEVPGLGEIAVPPASVVDVGGVTVPYRVRFTGGCFDDLQQKVEATADLTGNSALLMNAAEIAVGILGSPVSLREVFTAPQAIVGKQRTVIKLLGRMPHLTEAGQCLISGGVGATGCVAGALGAIIASPSERQDLATVVKTLGDMRPDHAIALQAVQNRLADARNAFDAYTAALRRCVGSTALPPQYDIVNFGVQFIAPVPVCTAGTPAVRPARAAAVVSARIDLAFAVVAAFPLGQVNTVAQVFQVTSDYLARTVAGALVDHLKFETTASTEPIGT